MAWDFPASPVDGQIFHNDFKGPIFIWSQTRQAWRRNAGTALPFNKVINPAMQISEQNGRTSSGMSALTYYCADQWVGLANVAGDEWAPRFSNTAYVTPNGSQYMLSSGMALSGGSPAASYLTILQTIEGNRIADLNYGTQWAKWAVLDFWVRNYVSRDYVYAVGIRNAAANRSISWPLPVPAYPVNAFYKFTFCVPPDTTGTWPVDNSASLQIFFSTMAGTSLQAPAAGTWYGANYLGVTGMVNLTSVTPGSFGFGDVGFYADPNMTGVAPQFVAPLYEDDLLDCLRYWYKAYRFNGTAYTTSSGIAYNSHYVPLRTTPAASVVGTLRLHDISQAPNCSGVANYQNHPDSTALTFSQAGTNFTVGRPFRTLVDGQVANYIAINARM